jgi:AcrR family transcriptional regulator
MARPRSEARRNAVLSAATRVIATQGLGASTASIAKAAGVSNGALFVYFETKTALLNELYVGLKVEMAAAALANLPAESDAREQLRHVWDLWLRWALANPEKRRALALLQICGEITTESHEAASEVQRLVAGVFERSWIDGPMSGVPVGFALTLTNAIAEAAIDAITRDPADAETHGGIAFDAIWRVLAGVREPTRDPSFSEETI